MSISVFRALLNNHRHYIPASSMRNLVHKFHWLRAHTVDGILLISDSQINNLMQTNPLIAEGISELIPHYKAYQDYMYSQKCKEEQSKKAHIQRIKAKLIGIGMSAHTL